MKTFKKYNRELPVTWICGFYRREVICLTQCEAADVCGVKQSNLSNFEKGRWQPGIYEAFVSMGVERFMERLTVREIDTMYELYTHYWALKLKKDYPEEIIIKEEWLNG